MRRRRLARVACVALLGALGCERKAPGPAECRAFALEAGGVVREVELDAPALRARVDDLTRTCLTTPFDRELLRCVHASGRLRACSREFEFRRRRDD